MPTLVVITGWKDYKLFWFVFYCFSLSLFLSFLVDECIAFQKLSNKKLSVLFFEKSMQTCLLAADSIAQASAKHLLISLCLQPLHPHRVNHTTVCDTVAVRSRLGVRLGLVNGRSDICEGARS